MKRIENNDKGQARFTFGGQLLNPLGATVLENSNSKKYRIANIAFENAKGVATQATAAIYEGNYSKGELTVGESYLCTATIAPNKEGKLTPYIQMSHLVAGAGMASLDDFDVESEVVETSATQLVGEIKS
jgi:hypothetical protein